MTPQLRSGSTELRSYLVDDWIAPDDHTLIVNAADRSLYQGRFRRACKGMRLTDTIAFIVPTPPEVSRFAGVVLPDGLRCTFTSLERVETPGPPGKDTTPAQQ